MIYIQLLFFPTKKLSFRRRVGAAWEFFVSGRPLWVRALLWKKLPLKAKLRVLLHGLTHAR